MVCFLRQLPNHRKYFRHYCQIMWGIIVLTLSGISPIGAAEGGSPLFDLSGATPMLAPEVDRRDFNIPDIDSENFELGIYGGVISIENFGANYLKGAYVSYFITEDFFISGNYATTSIEDDVYRRMNLPLFGVSGTRAVKNTGVMLGWNALSGELFWLDKQSFTADLFVLAGMSTIDFDTEEHSAASGGLGVRIIPRDWFAIKFESRFSEYKTNILGYRKYHHNFEVTTGISIFF